MGNGLARGSVTISGSRRNVPAVVALVSRRVVLFVVGGSLDQIFHRRHCGFGSLFGQKCSRALFKGKKRVQRRPLVTTTLRILDSRYQEAERTFYEDLALIIILEIDL